MPAVLAVDVGTGSARAGVFSGEGELLGHAAHPLRLSRPAPGLAEQDSTDIWQAVTQAAHGAIAAAGVPREEIRGLAFDATCSLVLLDAAGAPLRLSPGEDASWDVIVWMDHRATAEAGECTATGADVLDYVGGVMSPEMQLPKLLWLKRHRPDLWARLGMAFDLADFLSWRATGSPARSACTLTCKWTWLPHREPHWSASWLAAAGLMDLAERTGVPEIATPVGRPVGRLTAKAAAELGLAEGCVVASGLIDAHAGALGTLGHRLDDGIDRHLALIAGTSNCHMALSREERRIPGVWGPYLGAVVDGFWLNEGGQSASGALLDHIVESHAGAAGLGPSPHETLAEKVVALEQDGLDIAPRLHVLPDFHGNRSPLADPGALGVVSGLDMSPPDEALPRLWWAAANAIGYGTRHIVDHMNASGYAIDRLQLSGGHAASPFMVQMYADSTGLPVLLSASPEPVLLGSAIAAAAAAGLHPGVEAAARAMIAAGPVVEPRREARALHERRYRVFLAMHEQRRALDAIA